MMFCLFGFAFINARERHWINKADPPTTGRHNRQTGKLVVPSETGIGDLKSIPRGITQWSKHQDSLAATAPVDARFAWIAAIEAGPQNTTYRLNAQTYFIDRQYKLPNGTQIIGTKAAEATKVVAVATKAVQKGGFFHGCGLNHMNRIGFVLGSRCRISRLHYVGIERARYPDSHPMCGGAPFQTPGCATPYCQNSKNESWLIFGGAPVHDSIVEDITIAGGTVQNAFWMPQTPHGFCKNITVRNMEVTGSCPRPGPCAPSANGTGGGGTWADGINIHGAHRDIWIEGNRIPHTGDDGI